MVTFCCQWLLRWVRAFRTMGFWQCGTLTGTVERGFITLHDQTDGVLEQEILLILMLERSDPAGLVWISAGEMNQGALRRGGADSLRGGMGA